MNVVFDQVGTPTYAADLAALIVHVLETGKYRQHQGIYHFSNEGVCSWYDFAKEIFRQAVELGRDEYSEQNVQVSPVTTKEYGVSKAARPFNSRLDKKKLIDNGFKPLPSWQDAVGRYLKDIEF